MVYQDYYTCTLCDHLKHINHFHKNNTKLKHSTICIDCENDPYFAVKYIARYSRADFVLSYPKRQIKHQKTPEETLKYIQITNDRSLQT